MGSASSALYVVIPGDLETRTGGYGYDRRIIAGLRELGWTVHVVALDGSFPAPTAAARAHAVQALSAIPDGSLVLADGLALGVLPDEVARERDRLKVIALVHHPLAGETGLDHETAVALEASERRALASVRAVVVTSRATAGTLRNYGVPPDRVTVVEPGTDPAPLAKPRAPSPEPLSLLCVATLTPRKGYEILIDALAAIQPRNWRLRCGGSLDRDPATTARVRAKIRAHGLDDRVELLGDLDAEALAAEYARADLFVLPTLYEGYGMAVAEALARGLPVVSTDTGAIDPLVTGGAGNRADFPAGLIVPPSDAAAFTAALERAVGDADLRAQLARGARIARAHLPRWRDSSARLAALLEREAGTAGFSAGWLALREPADHAARSQAITEAAVHAVTDLAAPSILDLACGTGSNFRFLSRLLPGASWLLVDHDDRLLARVPLTAGVETRRLDLSTLDDRSLFAGRSLVTASALLDLVSDDWLRSLAERCADASVAAALFALNYDGRIECTPADSEDAAVVALVNQHQRTDKGFGPALGPDATERAAHWFTARGYRVQRERSDWRLTPESAELQRQLMTGWAGAAAEVAPSRREAIEAWHARRVAHLNGGRSTLIVGHEDLMAIR